MRRLLLVRHCESSGPQPEASLTANGLRHARRLAEALEGHPIDRIVSSPFRRARQTIAPLATLRALDVEIEPRLAERRLAVPPVDDWRAYVRRSFIDPDSRAPGGESAREVLERGRAAITQYFESASRLPVLVTHGQLLSLVLHSIDARFGYADWQRLRNPDVFVLRGASTARLDFERLGD